MNYESLYSEYLAKEKELRDFVNNQQKAFKRLSKEMEKGDIKNAVKTITALNEAAQNANTISAAIKELADGFDIQSYIQSGEFAEEMLRYCEESGVDAKGENNIYELFPYKVKLDGENSDIYLDRKKVMFFRPKSLVGFIKTQRDKLMSVFFNPLAFANELASAYDMSLLVLEKTKKREISHESDVHLTNIYKYLTPMKRFRKDYDAQSFAFDIARLLSSDLNTIDDGRKFQFGPSRQNEKSIRVLDKNSKEQFLATIRFYTE